MAERYTLWSDYSCGINPFTSLCSARHPGILYTLGLVKLTIGIMVEIVTRLLTHWVVLVLSQACMLVYRQDIYAAAPILVFSVCALLSPFLKRLSLLMFGVNVSLKQPLDQSSRLFISSLHSPIEILVLDYYLPGALYVFPASNGSECVCLSALSAVVQAYKGFPLSGESLEVSALMVRRPVVVFMEGASTNTSGVLHFSQVLSKMKPSDLPPCSVISCVYPVNSFPGNSVSCLSGMLHLTSLLLPCQLHSQKLVFEANTTSSLFMQFARQSLAKLSLVKLLSLSAADYHSFRAYHCAYTSGNSVDAKTIAESRAVKKK